MECFDYVVKNNHNDDIAHYNKGLCFRDMKR